MEILKKNCMEKLRPLKSRDPMRAHRLHPHEPGPADDSGTTSTHDDDTPPVVDAYAEDNYDLSGDRKDKSLAHKW